MSDKTADAHKPYVTVTNGLRGFFAVLVCWNEEMDGYEPWNTSDASYAAREGAEEDAKAWAEAENVEYRP